jgi:hypothetical protein
MYAFQSNTEHVPVFLSAGNLVLIRIPAESGRNVPPSTQLDAINKGTMATSSHLKILTFQEETKKLGCLALRLG